MMATNEYDVGHRPCWPPSFALDWTELTGLAVKAVCLLPGWSGCLTLDWTELTGLDCEGSLPAPRVVRQGILALTRHTTNEGNTNAVSALTRH